MDGHHRYKIARELEIKEIPVIVENFASFLDELSFVVKVNALRRQLNDYQKAMVAFELEKIEGQKARQRQIDLAGTRKSKVGSQTLVPFGTEVITMGRAAEIAAKNVGISTRTYQRAKTIIEKGDDKIKEAVRSNKVSISKAEKDIRNKEVRKQRIAQLMQQSCSDDNNSFDTSRFKLFHGNFIEQQQNIADNSIDLIFTDPPYNQKSIQLYRDLGNMAFRVLKEGGSLLCYSGHYALPEIFKLLEGSGLRYWWIIAVVHNGHVTRAHKHKVWPHWKPILWFTKGTKNNAPTDIGDLIESKPTDKSLHDWQQSTVEAEYCITHLTVQNQTVLDPFMGSGTTGIAALKLNRKFIGIESDIATMKIAETILLSKSNSGSYPS